MEIAIHADVTTWRMLLLNHMKLPKHDNDRPLTIALVIALGLGALMLRPFFSLIITAVIVAFIFAPVYSWLLAKTKKPSSAAMLTLLTTIVVLIIPVGIVIAATIAQANTLISDVGSYVGSQDFGKLTQEFINWLNSSLSNITGKSMNLTYDQITSYVSGYLSQFASFMVDVLKGWVGSLGSIITNIVLYVYVFLGVLVNSDKLTRSLRQLNPLGPQVTDTYIEKAGAMTKAMVKGQFIIAIIQGTVSAAVLGLLGVPYVAFLLLVLTFLSIIPLGAGIVTIPLGIGMMLLGNFWGGLVVVLNHVLIVTNIDNVLKPKLVPQSVRLHPALILLAIFGGMGLFGFLGIIVGPVLMILIVTTIQIYLDRPRSLKTKNPNS